MPDRLADLLPDPPPSTGELFDLDDPRIGEPRRPTPTATERATGLAAIRRLRSATPADDTT